MNVFARNERTKKALGIASIEFMFYRANQSHWRVKLDDGESFTVALPNLSTESSVLRVAAEKLAKSGRPVKWPQGA